MRQPLVLALVVAVGLLAGACTSTHPDTHTNVAPIETVTGKVVSFTDSTVTIATVTGQETLGMTTSTRGRDLVLVGAKLAFAFERSSGRGEPVVTLITANPSPAEPH